MASKERKVKVYKPQREKIDVPKKKGTPHRVSRFFLVALQAFCGALIGVCFFVYNTSSMIQILGYEEPENVSFGEASRDYLESEYFTENLDYVTEDIIKQVAFREIVEENGVYNPNKIIDIGELGSRFSEDEYTGPSVKYYLEDLVEWGRLSTAEAFSFCTYEFYTASEYCNFFGIDMATLELPENYDDSKTYISFETLKEQYFTADGFTVQSMAKDEKEYQEIVNCLTKSVSCVYAAYQGYFSTYRESARNYVQQYLLQNNITNDGQTIDLYTDEYIESNGMKYEDRYAYDKTNVRYYLSFSRNNRKYVYSNVPGFANGIMTDKELEESFKGYGKFISARPGRMEYITNTKVLYDTLSKTVLEDYSYAFEPDTRILIGVDTSYPVNDVFRNNKDAFEKTARVIPWIVSLGALSLIIFASNFVYIWLKEKKYYSEHATKEELGRFDRLPIEISVLFVVLLGLVFYIGETQLFGSLFSNPQMNLAGFYLTAISFLFVDLYIALLFIYGFERRYICKNLLDGSIFSMIAPKFTGKDSGLRKWFNNMFDSSGVAIRTWTIYVLFLLFNCFWVCLMFFSKYKVISFLVLFVFDTGVGAYLFNRNYERKNIVDGIRRISGGDYDYKIDLSKTHGDNKELANAVNDIGLGLSKALEISTKDEKLKADLITNVSHDIKTPLTSIINYVDLLKRENIEDENVQKYIKILDEKSQRLKQLTFDLLEASKVASGNISIDLIKIDFVEFLKQAAGEFEDKFTEKGLDLVMNVPADPVYAMVDPRHMWRVVENILNNVYKYALENSRVYLDLVSLMPEGEEGKKLVLSLKNISKQQLNIPADELTERFIRGDVSRSTEGSGLGLSIAKNLTIAQNGEFDIYLDGDLFKVTISLDITE